MDKGAKVAVTKALDNAIVSVASERFKTLGSELSNQQQIAKRIYESLRSLVRLQSGRMPNYDEWDALFYSLWYQPGHVNLAYTLTRLLPEEINPLKSGRGNLQVVDFGCGALAMQFGLSLAATDALEERGTVPSIAIMSQDASKPMREIGWNIWQCFVEEIGKYSELNSLQEMCKVMKFDAQDDPDAARWLTALHVAYRECSYKAKIEQGLGELVQGYDPRVVLITTHPQNIQSAYSPGVSAYEKHEKTLRNQNYLLNGYFPETTLFRCSLYRQFTNCFDEMYPWEKDFVQTYLTSYSTSWVPDTGFDSGCILYTKR